MSTSTAETPDCVNCPSYLPEDKTPAAFKKSPGAPMCAAFGHVLGKHGLKPAAAAKITVAFARGCKSFGEAAPLSPPVRPEARVAVGDPEVLMEGDTTPEQQAEVTSCLQCANYIKPDAVKREMGWTFGLCAASGRLLWPTRLAPEARNCPKRLAGEPRATTTGVVLLPAFEEAFDYSRSPIEAFLAGKPKTMIDPKDYPTDKEVTPEWAEAGVRAWRCIEDPDGTGNVSYLPIYRADFFSPAEQAKIPQTGDDEAPDRFVDYAGIVYSCTVLWQELDETPILWGMPGVGKTEAFRHMAWLMQIPFDRISITNSSEVDDLAGKFVAEEGAMGATVTKFVYGRLPKRWTTPGLCLVDEYNAAMSDVEQFLRPLIDNSKALVLDQNEGEELRRDGNCFLGLTGNPAHDAANTGVNTLAQAAADRLMHIEVGLPPEALEREILRQRCEEDGYAIPAETLDKIMRIANGEGRSDTEEKTSGGIRDLKETLNTSWGLRPQIKVARLSRWFDLLRCYRLAAGDNLEPETRAALLDVVKQYHVT